MSPEGLNSNRQERSITDRMRDILFQSSPEHWDLIRGRDAVVTAYCEANGISKDDITIDQLLEIRALPEWQNPFSIQPSTE
jgi:hypothetical protein